MTTERNSKVYTVEEFWVDGNDLPTKCQFPDCEGEDATVYIRINVGGPKDVVRLGERNQFCDHCWAYIKKEMESEGYELYANLI